MKNDIDKAYSSATCFTKKSFVAGLIIGEVATARIGSATNAFSRLSDEVRRTVLMTRFNGDIAWVNRIVANISNISNQLGNVSQVTKARVNSFIRQSESIKLSHIFEKHVGKSYEYLRTRVINGGNDPQPATSFTNKAIMEEAVYEWFKDEKVQEKIQELLNKSRNGRASSIQHLSVNLNKNLGYGYKLNSNTNQPEKINYPLTKVRVFLESDRQGGFYIKTAFIE